MIGLAASTNAVLKNLGSLLGITLMVMVFAWLSQARTALGGAAYGNILLPEGLRPGGPGGGPQPGGQFAAAQALRQISLREPAALSLGPGKTLCYYRYWLRSIFSELIFRIIG